MRLARYRPRLPLVVALALAAAAIAWWSPSDAQVPNPSDVADDGFAPGEVIVGFEEGALSGQSTDALLAGASVADRSESLGAERVVLPPGVSVEQAISELQDAPGVAFVEPNYLLHASAEPNDPLYPRQQFNLDVIGAPAAWDTNTDASGAILAIIDTGVDLEHEDLAGQLWTNPNEIPGDGIDNDHNGCPDDVHGCNFISPSIGDSCGYQALPPHSDVRDDAAHGTRVAGIAAAAGDNGIGIAGMGWQGRLMIIKAMDCEKSGSSFDVARAIDYAVANKASIINLSLGGSGRSEMLIQAIDRATNAGVLLVAATGNLGPQVNFPANLPNVLAVGASGAFDAPDSRAPFSNWGPEVDVVAPGIDVLSTAPIVAASPLAPNQSLLVAAQPAQPQRLNVVVEDRKPSIVSGSIRIEGTSIAGEPLVEDLPISGAGRYRTSEAYLSVESVTPLNVGPLDGGDDERISVNDGYDPGDGTSFSAPFVAGTAALMLSRNPTLSGIEVMDIIKAAAQDLPDAGEPNWDGAGRLRANVALAAVPATFLGRVTSQGAPAGPGIRIDAYVGEQLCGSTVSTFGTDGSSEYQLDVASAMLQPGCGTEGATVRITVAGANTAVEAPWNGTVTSIDLETALGTSGTGIELEAGWNLVAFSFTPTTTSIESLLAPLGDAAVSAITFDEAEQVFRFFVPGNPGVSDFTELPPLAGMWLRVSGPVTLVVPDSGVPPPETVELVAGLNLVGLPLNGPVPIAETVASIQGALLSILGFTDGLDGAFLVYLPDGSLATLTELRPNEGYWFVASEATTLRP